MPRIEAQMGWRMGPGAHPREETSELLNVNEKDPFIQGRAGPLRLRASLHPPHNPVKQGLA